MLTIISVDDDMGNDMEIGIEIEAEVDVEMEGRVVINANACSEVPPFLLQSSVRSQCALGKA